MLKETEPKTCGLCGKPLKGRSDKKFCDDYCRAAYNNELKSVSNNYTRNINNMLGKNRRILEGLLKEGKAAIKINREKLEEKGFQFKYHTHIYTARNGNTYHYCYEFGYLLLDNNKLLIVKKNDG